MSLEKLKELESKATPGPWKGRELICFGIGQATGPEHELTSKMQPPYPWYFDAALIYRLRNLAPELLALWEEENTIRALIDGGQVLDVETDRKWEILRRLNEKAAGMFEERKTEANDK